MEENGQIVKQNELKVIQCDRCGKDFTRFTHLRRHFHNKFFERSSRGHCVKKLWPECHR